MESKDENELAKLRSKALDQNKEFNFLQIQNQKKPALLETKGLLDRYFSDFLDLQVMHLSRNTFLDRNGFDLIKFFKIVFPDYYFRSQDYKNFQQLYYSETNFSAVLTQFMNNQCVNYDFGAKKFISLAKKQKEVDSQKVHSNHDLARKLKSRVTKAVLTMRDHYLGLQRSNLCII